MPLDSTSFSWNNPSVHVLTLKPSVLVSCPFFCKVVHFFLIHLREFFIYFGCEFFARYLRCKYLLPRRWEPGVWVSPLRSYSWPHTPNLLLEVQWTCQTLYGKKDLSFLDSPFSHFTCFPETVSKSEVGTILHPVAWLHYFEPFFCVCEREIIYRKHIKINAWFNK